MDWQPSRMSRPHYLIFYFSDYTVNAMDVEELRRSQRRSRKPRSTASDISGYTLRPPSSTVSVSGSQDSDEEEDEASTPSAELAERNFLSLQSIRYQNCLLLLLLYFTHYLLNKTYHLFSITAVKVLIELGDANPI